MKPKSLGLKPLALKPLALKPLGMKPLSTAQQLAPGDMEGDGLTGTGSEPELEDLFAAMKEASAAPAPTADTFILDSPIWVCFCFQTREQKTEALRKLGLSSLGGDKYVDGREVAALLGLTSSILPKRGQSDLFKVGGLKLPSLGGVAKLALPSLAPAEEEAPKRELSAKEKGFKERAKEEARRFREATDSEFWVACCFLLEQERDTFVAELGLSPAPDHVYDGRLWAALRGIRLTSPDLSVGRVDKSRNRFTDLALPLPSRRVAD